MDAVLFILASVGAAALLICGLIIWAAISETRPGGALDFDFRSPWERPQSDRGGRK